MVKRYEPPKQRWFGQIFDSLFILALVYLSLLLPLLFKADAAADADVLGVEFFGGGEGFGNKDIDHGFLEGGAEVREAVGGVFPKRGEQIEHGGFETAEAEGEIAAVLHAAGEIEGGGVAGAGEFVDLRTAGVGETKHAGDFIKGLAGGVVAGAAQ